MKKNITYLILICLLQSLAIVKIAPAQLVSNYKKNENLIHPEFVIFHVNDTVSELHFKINTKELLYTRPDGINFSANVLISYQLQSFFDSKQLLDSASLKVVDADNNQVDKYLMGKINVKAKLLNSYYLRVKITDINRKIEVTKVLVVEKENNLSRQNFLFKVKSSSSPLFHNYTKVGDSLLLDYKIKKEGNVYVSYYKRDFLLAPPPFSTVETQPFQYKPDSIYTIKLNDKGCLPFVAMKKGFYHFRVDTTKQDGSTLFVFSETFPEIKKAQDLVPPLRFITSRQEFDELITSENPKLAIEKFWIECAGNQDRARELIRKYYNRVEDANLFFTSYLEGWKTDRGMVYLIYGAPNAIYKTTNVETWTYGDEHDINALSFAFLKVKNPFTDNDYNLERSTMYRQSWGMAVDTWRQGRMYSED